MGSWIQGFQLKHERPTIFVLADPQNVRLYSGLAIPSEPGEKKNDEKSLIETVSLAPVPPGRNWLT